MLYFLIVSFGLFASPHFSSHVFVFREKLRRKTHSILASHFILNFLLIEKLLFYMNIDSFNQYARNIKRWRSRFFLCPCSGCLHHNTCSWCTLSEHGGKHKLHKFLYFSLYPTVRKRNYWMWINIISIAFYFRGFVQCSFPLYDFQLNYRLWCDCSWEKYVDMSIEWSF